MEDRRHSDHAARVAARSSPWRRRSGSAGRRRASPARRCSPGRRPGPWRRYGRTRTSRPAGPAGRPATSDACARPSLLAAARAGARENGGAWPGSHGCFPDRRRLPGREPGQPGFVRAVVREDLSCSCPSVRGHERGAAADAYVESMRRSGPATAAICSVTCSWISAKCSARGRPPGGGLILDLGRIFRLGYATGP
jgi:hypothetical protein